MDKQLRKTLLEGQQCSAAFSYIVYNGMVRCRKDVAQMSFDYCQKNGGNVMTTQKKEVQKQFSFVYSALLEDLSDEGLHFLVDKLYPSPICIILEE